MRLPCFFWSIDIIYYLCTDFHDKGVLAHLARALDWQSKGDRFESDMLHKKNLYFVVYTALFITVNSKHS